MSEVPDTPKLRMSDVEKANPKVTSFEMAEPRKESKWAKKLGR